MSFDFKGPNIRPMIQETQQMKNNGGGGNLGYFQRQNSDEKKKEEQVDVFNNNEQDSFEHKLEIEEEKIDFSSIKLFFKSLIQKIKKYFIGKHNPFI